MNVINQETFLEFVFCGLWRLTYSKTQVSFLLLLVRDFKEGFPLTLPHKTNILPISRSNCLSITTYTMDPPTLIFTLILVPMIQIVRD